MQQADLVTFEAVEKRGAGIALASLLSAAFTKRSIDWKVWATTPDGTHFVVRDDLDEGEAKYLAHAYAGQFAEADSPELWARSKGFDALAMHLHRLLR